MSAVNQKLDGFLSVNRYGGQDEFRIRVEDKIGRCTFLEIVVDAADLMKALGGLSCVPCVNEIYKSAPVGMEAQNKAELVEVTDYAFGNKAKLAEIRKAAKTYEVDGWKARSGDIDNSHNFVRQDGKKYIRVAFFRHVKPSADPTN